MKDKSQELCRYFGKPSGCKRGDKCVYSHSMSSMDKELRAKKCLRCGSESHRARECTVGKQAQRTGTQGGSAATKPNDKVNHSGASPAVSMMSTAAPSTTSAGTSLSSTAPTIQGVPWTLESLVQVAQQVIQGQAPQDGESSPEKTRAEVKVITVRDIRVSSTSQTSTALLDSGATHSLRSAYSDAEWFEAEEVDVQLAGGGALRMRLSAGGSLLMPPRGGTTTSSRAATAGGQTIVPLGELVKVLGYSLEWSQKGCFLKDGEGNVRSLGVSNGCPHLKEAEALALIARLEDRKLEMLENAAALTQDSLDTSLLMMETSWKEHLLKYVGEGNMQAGLRAVRDAPFLADLPGECVDGLVQDNLVGDGWAILKNIEFLTRPQRRKLWGAKRWVIHLYAGAPGHYEVFRLDDVGTVVLELDIQRCKAHDLLRSATWRLVMWAAMTGRVEAILGGPPGRGGLFRGTQHNAECDVKSIKLVARMLWLYAIADAGRSLNAKGMERGRPVAFVLEHPTGVTEEEPSSSTRRQRGSLWESAMWRDFAPEYGMAMVKFDQKGMGMSTSSRTTLGTNVYYLTGLEGLTSPGSPTTTSEQTTSTSEWSPGLVQAIVMAMRFWIRHPRQVPVLAAFTPEQWKRHVDSNHSEYRRDCLTCVMSRGTGKRHGRVRNPEMFSLTVDLAGPVKPGLDVTSKGTMGRGLKYMMVARYVLPKEYVKSYAAKDPPGNHGMDTEMPMEQVDGDGRRGNKELSEPSSLPPQDEGARADSDKVNEELSEPFSLPPQDEGDPFILVDEEPGEQGLVFDEEPGEQGHRQPHGHGPRFYRGTDQQKRDYEDSMCEYSEDEHQDGPDPGDDQRSDQGGGGHLGDPYPDCEAPESTYLLFAKALPSNGSVVVKAAIQDIVLYLQSRGLPVFRLHADKGETFNHRIRMWLRDQGIRATWSEPGIPQGNGQAESTVRWIKDMARTLLLGSRLPTRLWPTAIEAVTAMQRAKVLNWKSKLIAPYGAVVHVKQKAFDSSGPRRRERAFETKWMRGHYVGLSGILENGHVVFVPGDEDRKEKFIHTFHVRPRLIDPGLPQQELQVEDPPKPKRKLPCKTPIERVEMRELQVTEEEFVKYIKRRSEQLLEDWDQEEAVSFVDELAEKRVFEDIKFGVFRHGGSVGWMRGFAEYPELSKVLAQLVLRVNPEATFTAIWVAKNSERGMHKDFNNDEQALNYVLPIRVPEKGGELWVELRQGNEVRGEVRERQDERGRRYFGQVQPLVDGVCNIFSPRQRHEVLPWEGTRTVLIAYTPQGLGKLTSSMIRELENYGFPPPITQFPEYFLKDPLYQANRVDVSRREEVEQLDEYLTEDNPQESAMITDEEVDDWEMFVEAEDGLVKIAETQEEQFSWNRPLLNKLEMSYTKGVEAILAGLKSPLEVVYNVDPKEVLENISAWEPAIRKEVDGVSVAIQRLLPNTELRRTWMQRPTAQRLPTKLVFTVKPNDTPDPFDRMTWYKRKVRLVVCGNFAASDNADLYTETPPSEAVRAGLIMSRRRNWSVALIDIVAAFLRTPLNPEAGDPVILVAPPRLLERLEITVEGELWGLVRALHGLRQAPALWAAHRDRVLQEMRFEGDLRLHRGRTITAWWTLRNSRDVVVAMVIIYVDDILLIGEEVVIHQLASEIQKMWRTSELSILRPGHPIRVLGNGVGSR